MTNVRTYKRIKIEKIILKGKSYSIGKHSTLFSNRTVYLVVEEGNTIKYQAKENANWQYLKTYILGFAFLFLQKNQMAIHCSSVACDKGALLLAAESGSGKSTLTRAGVLHGTIMTESHHQ